MSKSLVVVNGVILAGCAIFFSNQQLIVVAALLFLPLLDKKWRWNCFSSFRFLIPVWLAIGGMFFILLINKEDNYMLMVSIILFTALPEEWFFRCYLLQQLRLFSLNALQANVICSVFFAFLHLPVQGEIGLLTFFPSLLLGYIYQQTRNLLLLISLHTLANLFYITYVREWLSLFLMY